MGEQVAYYDGVSTKRDICIKLSSLRLIDIGAYRLHEVFVVMEKLNHTSCVQHPRGCWPAHLPFAEQPCTPV